MQTSALPLGDGAGRNRSVCEVFRPRLQAATTACHLAGLRSNHPHETKRRESNSNAVSGGGDEAPPERSARERPQAAIHNSSAQSGGGDEAPPERSAQERPQAASSKHRCAERSGRRSARVTKRTRRGQRPRLTTVAHGAESASKRRRSGVRRSAHGARRSNIGAGNGIRTRDFDLGKVALYH